MEHEVLFVEFAVAVQVTRHPFVLGRRARFRFGQVFEPVLVLMGHVSVTIEVALVVGIVAFRWRLRQDLHHQRIAV